MIKKRILFVDDEAKVLEGLRRMLYSMRNEWEMMFITSAKKALQILEGLEFDVIVSDMKMPEMDGAELLNIVKEKYPHIIRIILSGYSDKDMIMRTLGATDQFLSKPCSPETLKTTINNVLSAQKTVARKELRALVSELTSLPTLPDLYVKLKTTLDSSSSSFTEIADIISTDVSVSAKVLQLVNSAFFGLRQRIENIHRAVVYLGMETLKAIVLTTDVFSKFTVEEVKKFHIDELYRHSVFVCFLARKIFENKVNNLLLIDEVGMMGLLHDIGKIVLIRNKPAEYDTIYKQKLSSPEHLSDLEEQILGITHEEVGGYLMALWGLPDPIVKGISCHHSPLLHPDDDFSTFSAVYIANVLAHRNAEDKIIKDNLRFDDTYISKLRVSEDIPKWQELCKSFIVKG